MKCFIYNKIMLCYQNRKTKNFEIIHNIRNLINFQIKI